MSRKKTCLCYKISLVLWRKERGLKCLGGKMKWLKLDANFYNDNRIIELRECSGDKGYILYITLLCMMSEQWNGEPEKTFFINVARIQAECGVYHRSILLQSMFNLARIFGLSYQHVGLNFEISYPKFLKKQGSYFRGATRGAASCATGIEKNRIEEKEIHKECVFSGEVKEIMNFFNKTLFKKLITNKPREKIIIKNLNLNRTVEQMKQAITNFSKDPWPDRKKYCDIVYCLGVRNGVDNFDKWFNNSLSRQQEDLSRYK